MADEITISKTFKIRDCGYDESWLQEQIASRPAILGLGDLVFVEREKRQVSGGRLDILLKNRAGDAMFEVEVMLGETDGNHITRTIEYWDLEQRQDSKREHFPVLVAEDVTRRFFNVIYRLSHSIPIIAIKTSIVEVAERKALHFTTILDSYQEPALEDRASTGPVNEEYWQAKAPWTLAHAKKVQETFSRVIGEMKLYFNRNDVQLGDAGGGRGGTFIALKRQKSGKSSFKIWLKNAETSVATSMLDNGLIPYGVEPNGDDSDWQVIRLTIDQDFIQKNDNLFQEMAKFYQRSCQRTGEN